MLVYTSIVPTLKGSSAEILQLNAIRAEIDSFLNIGYICNKSLDKGVSLHTNYVVFSGNFPEILS